MRADHRLKLSFLLMMIHTVFAYYQKLIKSAFEDTEKSREGICNVINTSYCIPKEKPSLMFRIIFNPLLEVSMKVNFVAIVPGSNLALVILES